MAGQKTSQVAGKAQQKRSYLAQADVPAVPLTQALRIPLAIAEHYAYKPTTPLNVAAGLKMHPNSGTFRLLCGAAIAYGLVKGGARAEDISVEPLGMRIVRPTKEGDDLTGKREALLKPRIIGEFLRKYNGAPLPRDDIARNVLVEMGVPIDRTDEVLRLIVGGAEAVGLLRTIKDKRYADLSGVQPEAQEETERAHPRNGESEALIPDGILAKLPTKEQYIGSTVAIEATPAERANRRVFITHGKNRALVDPIKKLLAFGEMKAVVSVERPSVSQPVPDKVIAEMRSCGAAIIHVEGEKKLIDQDAKEHTIINPNVLIEIGAAMALFGRRFILLVKEGVELPSNLQGLYEVRYKGDQLDGEATIKLLEAINDIKNHPLPDIYSTGSPEGE